jgi:hypothetical protein
MQFITLRMIAPLHGSNGSEMTLNRRSRRRGSDLLDFAPGRLTEQARDS